MVELSRTCNDVDFLLVTGDESEKGREICKREKIEKVPHFSFYKSMEKIHEEKGITQDKLTGHVLYYGDNHSAVLRLHCRENARGEVDRSWSQADCSWFGVEVLWAMREGLSTVIKLSRQMSDTVVFARMNGDEIDSCMQFLKDMDVVEVHTLLFIRDGKICGRYVGSGKGKLIGEILRYQGVRVTYESTIQILWQNFLSFVRN